MRKHELKQQDTREKRLYTDTARFTTKNHDIQQQQNLSTHPHTHAPQLLLYTNPRNDFIILFRITLAHALNQITHWNIT